MREKTKRAFNKGIRTKGGFGEGGRAKSQKKTQNIRRER